MDKTVADQWQYQILARVLEKHRVILVTRPELKETVAAMKMEYAASPGEALERALAAKGKDFVVVIDPGHGGHDPGAIGRRGKEKNINLNVALKVGQLIQNNCNDVKVIYTRKTDVFIPLDRRAQIANNAKADLFISIHTNSIARGRTVR